MEPKDIRILLVDDENGFRRPMEFWLKAKGYQVTGVGSGEEGLASIERERPTLVYLDMKMPGMNGIETLRRIRDKDKTLPVIMITAYGTLQDMEEAEKLGVSGFFKKDEDFATAAKLIIFALESSKII
ncbi:MAG: response regulator [Verrucomicrobia bacterium]|nr:response regulator [Verrucomicrobiota bacterium]MCG2680191.1 response regulator [Kiritimatiellia bacterium]MBU4247509.1 response regulator [Verrucomicrobiota bacterium]MBU4289478.1 response regulator [Verrucomicrobiota bacterium]MBU4429953.1 response regulator [Verrucomicrobiota bacterium]